MLVYSGVGGKDISINFFILIASLFGSAQWLCNLKHSRYADAIISKNMLFTQHWRRVCVCVTDHTTHSESHANARRRRSRRRRRAYCTRLRHLYIWRRRRLYMRMFGLFYDLLCLRREHAHTRELRQPDDGMRAHACEKRAL